MNTHQFKTLFFSSKSYDSKYFSEGNQDIGLSLDFNEVRLSAKTAALCDGYQAVCLFVNDIADSTVLHILSKLGIKHIALRCAGFNNVDIAVAKQIGISVSRVPAYSPEAVAEHTLALILTLDRKTHKAYNRVRENNFSLEGLMGFNLHGKTTGIVGTGKIGKVVINILQGFGCKVLCYDPYPDPLIVRDNNATYVDLETLISSSDIISLHCPLTPQSQHLINQQAIAMMKPDVMLINTSRGALMDATALIQGLKQKKIGYLGMDVYEMESELFFEDKSYEIMQDDVFDRLAGFPNVLITGHQGFFTNEAMQQIAQTTLQNLLLVKNSQTNSETFLT